MLDLVIIVSVILVAGALGFQSVEWLPPETLEPVQNVLGLRWVLSGFAALIVGLPVGVMVQGAYRRLERQLRQWPIELVLTRAVGLVLGLLVANLLLAPLFVLPIPAGLGWLKPLAAVVTSLALSYVGMSVADTHGPSLLRLISPNSVQSMLLAEGTLQPAASKILDSSVIIDGRIEPILATQFLEGQLIVPRFVLAELQALADSSNDQRRSRGRKGLELLKRLQQNYSQRLVIHSADYPDLETVDAKLVRLAQELNAMLLTNDYGLNQVATVQGVRVLNINDLAQALRVLYQPGDTLDLKILKEGKEPSQGVGYLEDGTMVVVEQGRAHIGDQLPVVVTGALQTSAGRMIFARPKTSLKT
ncbi:MAG: PIN/TRAM domain-containing protein [Gloeomargarita sp. SKYG116]|nr:PIN/TRAM domain-containing protein [Gloeomargarita sp. SKYG116]MCS7225822.1 PIN/TRAM domain-containing protein [Gloeomargarita sp. SKYB31]MDW8401026.1 PIN/TRAM domain-containing protein [Gloeomargarita sp. SKYGB_i_bin116]